MIRLQPGKLNVLIGGQYGSEGKGSIAGYLAYCNNIDISISNGSPNAGHTFRDNFGRRVVVYHLPMSGALSHTNQIYLGPGSIIDPVILRQELEDADIDFERVWIHPRAAIITKEDIAEEQDPFSGAARVASTQHGVGAALAHKVRRDRPLAEDCRDILPGKVTEHYHLHEVLGRGATALVEVGQGLGLAINSGRSYPFCTGREVSVSQTLADCQVHPSFLGRVVMAVRTYPIRVGNLHNSEGEKIGHSGPWYHDQEELTWEQIGVPPELTTVTKRVRRVATWSDTQYRIALDLLRPDVVFLNFVNYLRDRDEFYKLHTRMTNVGKAPEYFGIGPTIDDIVTTEDVSKRMGWA
jgi:adenylosuccinate synthase